MPPETPNPILVPPPESPQLSAPSTSGSFVWAILLGVVVILALGAGAIYLYSNSASEPVEIKPSGSLYLGLSPLGQISPKVHKYNLDSDKLEPLSLVTPNSSSVSISPSGTLLAYVGWAEDKLAHVFVADLSKNINYQLTSDAPKLSRSPRWSNNEQFVAFTASPSDFPDLNLNSWGAYMSNLRGEVTKIASGAYPEWLSDSRGVLLREEGLYAFDTSTKKIAQLLPITNGTAGFNMRLAVSPDRSKLAWSLPSSGKILLYNVESLEPVSLKLAKEISSSSFWMVFSPDGRFLAAQEVDWDKIGGANPNPRINIFDLDTGLSIRKIDLSKYNQQSMFLSDWR